MGDRAPLCTSVSNCKACPMAKTGRGVEVEEERGNKERRERGNGEEGGRRGKGGGEKCWGKD